MERVKYEIYHAYSSTTGGRLGGKGYPKKRRVILRPVVPSRGKPKWCVVCGHLCEASIERLTNDDTIFAHRSCAREVERVPAYQG